MNSHPITQRYPGRVLSIESKCGVAMTRSLKELQNATTKQEFEIYRAIWDTGATMTCITPKIVEKLSLKEVSIHRNYTAAGITESSTYYVDLLLPNNIVIQRLKVACCDLSDTDLLIGMDVITMGDFAISNYDNQTTFSFRIPSQEEINFETIIT